jgi:hypothetical protein
MLAAHGYLALNRANDALFLFGYAQDHPEDLSAWLAWAQAFARSHPGSAIAHYFAGDALARTKDLAAAASEFDAGLKISPADVLLLNARGVVFGLNGQLPEARACFEAAVKASNSKSADAFANIGYFWIQSQEGAEGAEQAFTQAITIAKANGSSFSTAIHGRMCVRLVLKSTKAEGDLHEMYLPATPLLDQAMNNNLQSYVARLVPQNSSVAVALAHLQEPGMNLTSTFTDIRNQLQAANDLSNNHDLPSQIIQNMMDNHAIVSLLQQPAAQQLPFLNSLPSNLRDTAVATIGNISSWNHSVAGTSQWIANSSTMLATGAAYTGNQPVALGSGISAIASNMLNQQSSAMEAMAKGCLDRLPTTMTPTAPQMPPTFTQPGGVTFSFDAVHWDDGDWRFRPLYALLYPARVTKAASQLPGH